MAFSRETITARKKSLEKKMNRPYIVWTVYCTVLYCTVLYCTVLYCTVLYCTVLYCTVLYCTVLYCTVLYCTVLYCTVLYCTVLYCTVLYCTVLYCTVLYCTVLYCTVLYCTVLYCTVLCVIRNYICHDRLGGFPSLDVCGTRVQVVVSKPPRVAKTENRKQQKKSIPPLPEYLRKNHGRTSENRFGWSHHQSCITDFLSIPR